MPKYDGDLLVVAFLVWVTVMLIRAWEVMILVGVLHSEASWPPYTLGYWICVPVAVLITGIFTPISTRRD